VDDVGLVINYNLPEDPEDYVHRIGRTGRAGEAGRSVCFASEFDSMMLPDIEKFIGRELSCTRPEEDWLEVEKRDIPKRQRRSGGGGGGRRGPPRGGRGGRGGGGRGRSRR
jgi:superfamily II DNA/RNA helicase